MEVLAKWIAWMRSRGARRVRAWMVGSLTVGVGLGSHAVFAQTAHCTGTDQMIEVQMPPSVTAPRDAQPGTVLTPWATTSSMTNYFTCTTTGSELVSGMGVQPLGLVKAERTVRAPGGETYTVWNTNVRGVGIAVGFRPYSNRCGWMSFWDLGAWATSLIWPWVGAGCGGLSPQSVGGQAQFALVKTGEITPGPVRGGVLFEGAVFQGYPDGFKIASSARIRFHVTQTDIIVGSCKTPPVTVDMGSYTQSIFRSIGSTTRPVSFKVDIKDCPAGMNSIEYQFSPTTSVVPGAPGVVTLSVDSTAGGIGLKLMDGNENGLMYDHRYPLSDYRSETGGTYTIPLKAAYYQTSSAVKAGTANAAVTFTLNYR